MKIWIFSIVIFGYLLVQTFSIPGLVSHVIPTTGGASPFKNAEKEEYLTKVANQQLCEYRDTQECWKIYQLDGFTSQVVAGALYKSDGIFHEKYSDIYYYGQISIWEKTWENFIEVTFTKGDEVEWDY